MREKRKTGRKDPAAASGVASILCMLITLLVVGILMQAYTSFVYDVEIKKSIERVVDTYTYVMEANGGLSQEEQQNLIDDLMSLTSEVTASNGTTYTVGVVDVSLSGSALYGNSGQGTAAAEYNEKITLAVECKCNVYECTSDGLTFSKKVSSLTANVKRSTISHGIY